MAVTFPSPEIEFIVGPLTPIGSTWFDQNQVNKGLEHGQAFPAAPPYRQLTGTLSLTKDLKTVTGSGTKFLSELPAPVNQFNFLIRDQSGALKTHYLASVEDDTHLTLSGLWASANQSGLSAFTVTGPELDQYTNANYYDLAHCLYTAFYRTSDVKFQTLARKVADSWWQAPFIDQGRASVDNVVAPRIIGLNGLMLRALDGRPEMWPWIVSFVRSMFDIWITSRITYPGLYYGPRESGYMLLYAANLGRCHPDPAIRDEFKTKALTGAVHYFARLQKSDGSWRWGDDAWIGDACQPFMMGLLLEGMIATHKLTGNLTVKNSIIKGAEAIYQVGYNPIGWRGSYYQIGGSWSDGTDCTKGCGAAGNPFPPSDPGQISEARQLNATNIHALGYAYALTNDPKFKTWGDEMFDATYVASDSYRGLAWFRAKEYDESYRAGGKYLAYRQGEIGATIPSPMPDPPVPTSGSTPTPGPTNPTLQVGGLVTRNGSPESGIVITMTDSSGNTLGTMTTNSSGKFVAEINPNQKGKIVAPQGYSPTSYTFDGSVSKLDLNFSVGTAPTPTPTPTPTPIGPKVGDLKPDVPWTVSETADNAEAKRQRAEGFYFLKHQSGKKATFVYTGVKLLL